MSLPPCVYPDPHGPGGCTCAHSHPGPFANSSRSTAGPSPILLPKIPHHAPHESHDLPKFHGTHDFPSSNIQNYNNDRKRKSNAEGQGGGGCKRQRVPAPIVAAPTGTCTICGVGPTIPVTFLPSDNDPPFSPQTPYITVQPSIGSLTSSQLPAASYPSLQANRKSKGGSSSATDVWYFCGTSNSKIGPAEPLLDQGPILKKKPSSPFITCKLCKCVFPSFVLKHDSYYMYL